jgi:hypothetical protein
MSERALAVVVGVPFDVEFGASSPDLEWHLGPLPPGIELISRIFRQSAAEGAAVQQLFHLRATEPRRYELAFTLRSRAEGTPVQTRVFAVEARGAEA